MKGVGTVVGFVAVAGLALWLGGGLAPAAPTRTPVATTTVTATPTSTKPITITCTVKP